MLPNINPTTTAAWKALSAHAEAMKQVHMKELFAKDAALRNSASVGQIYELLETKKSAFDPRAFITPIMDTIMYGNVPDDDVARICTCIEDGVKEAIAPLLVKFGSYGKAPKVERVTIDEMAERYRKAGI